MVRYQSMQSIQECPGCVEVDVFFNHGFKTVDVTNLQVKSREQEPQKSADASEEIDHHALCLTVVLGPTACLQPDCQVVEHNDPHPHNAMADTTPQGANFILAIAIAINSCIPCFLQPPVCLIRSCHAFRGASPDWFELASVRVWFVVFLLFCKVPGGLVSR